VPETRSSLKQLFDLSGQVALITGGSRGLGLQIAEGLGEYGAHVVVVARKEEELTACARTLRSQGINTTAISADVSQPEEIDQVMQDLERQDLGIDILVNNAGTSWGAPSEDLPLSAWSKLMAINLTTPFLLSQKTAKRWMLPRGRGRILNVASVEGLQGHHPRMIGTLAYNASKGGLINFTRALAAEWGPHGLTVNALAPGYFPSRMTSYVLEKFETELIDDTPRGALGGPNDLKGAALLFASAAGAHINGQILAIDGGASVI
jgi:gluconate 5-dehydrogenase